MSTTAHPLAERLDPSDCPHIAVFIPSVDELPPVLASFYTLGAARNGWLLHGSRPGDVRQERRRLAEAGLDVEGLEVSDRLLIFEFDLTVDPDHWADRWSELGDARLAAGFDAVWYARFPVPPTDPEVEAMLPFEEAWIQRSRGRRVVTLCPYIVPQAAAGVAYSHLEALRATHDGILDMRGRSRAGDG